MTNETTNPRPDQIRFIDRLNAECNNKPAAVVQARMMEFIMADSTELNRLAVDTLRGILKCRVEMYRQLESEHGYEHSAVRCLRVEYRSMGLL